MNRNRFTLWLALAALAIGCVVFYRLSAWASRGGEDSPLYSNRRHDPYGAAALYELLRERGVTVRALERPHLEPTDRGTLIQVLPLPPTGWQRPPQVPPGELMEWMAEGNTVVQLTRTRTELMDLAGVPGDKLPPAATAPANAPGPWAKRPPASPDEAHLRSIEDLERRGQDPELLDAALSFGDWEESPAAGGDGMPPGPLMLVSPARFPYRGPAAAWRPLASDGRDVLAGELRVGRGRLIVVGAPTPALNGGLALGGNLEALLAMVGGGPAIIDEWSHGIGHGGTMMAFIRQVGLGPVVFQALVVFAFYHWSTRGHRRRDTEPSTRRRSTLEQVETLGYLYGQTLPIDVIHSRVQDEVRRRLSEALRCRPEALSARLAALPEETRRKAQRVLDAGLKAAEHGGRPLCPACGYDLTAGTAANCPECGAAVPVEVRERVAAAAASGTAAAEKTRGRRRIEAELARVLTLSHDFATEVARDRNAFR